MNTGVKSPEVRERGARRGLAWAVACVAVALSARWTAGCGPTVRQAAAVSVSTAGSVLAAVQAEHQRVYVEATDALRTRLRQGHGTLAEYEREVAPLDEVFRKRGAAIQTLDASLYAAATLIDARGGEPREVHSVLVALRDAVAVLREGDVLPAVAVPAQVEEAIRRLEAVAAKEDGDE